MYSGFMDKKRRQETASDVQHRTKSNHAARAASSNSHFLNSQSMARTSQWVQQNVNTKTASILANGSAMLLHPEHHQFRDYSPLGNVYVRQ